RLFDFSLSLVLLVITAPLFVFIALFIRLFMGKPIFFQQERPGRYGNPFKLYKFRTMKVLYGPDGKLLADQERMTSFGKVLRKSSLDELPQLINVLRGEMSLVGPRPLLLEYLPLYTKEQKRRHHVRPGITGWAQVNGRNAVSWEERFKMDVSYVQNNSLGLDMKILFLTIVKVLRRENVTEKNHVTIDKFNGTKDGH